MEIISFNTEGSAIAKNAFWGFLLQVLLKFKGVILLPIIVHFLSSDVIGEWRIITTTVAVLLPVISLNLFDGSGMFFSSDVDKDSVRKKYYSVLNVTLTLEAVALFLCIVVSWLFHLVDLKLLLLVCLYFSVMYVFKASILLLQTYQKSRMLMIVNLIAEYGGFLISLVLIAFGVRDILVMLLPPVILNSVLSIYLLVRIGREIPYQKEVDRQFIREALPISLSLLPVYLAEWLLMSIGIYALNHYYGQGEVGHYSVLISLASLALALRATLQFFWFSTCSNMIRRGDPKFTGFFKVVLKVYLLIIGLALLMYAGFSRELILVMANREYLPIEKGLYLVVAGNCLMVLSCLWNGILYARGEGYKITASYLVAGAVALVLTFCLVPQFKLEGAGFAYFVANAILFGMMCWKAGKVGLVLSSGEKRFCLILLLFVLTAAALKLFGAGHVVSAILCGIFVVVVMVLNEVWSFIPLHSIGELIRNRKQ